MSSSLIESDADWSKIKINRTKQIVNEVQHMKLKHIRQIMSMLHNPTITADHLLPGFGFTIGEFCVAYVVRDK